MKNRGLEVCMDWTGDDEEQLRREHEEYCKLQGHHRDYQEKLARFAVKRTLTEEEKQEEVRAKKEKLFVKDRMAAIRREYAASRS